MNEFKQNKGLNRNTIDKYYTKATIVELLLNFIREYLSISYNNDIIIEPSAGNGSFINGIKELTKNYEFYDIKPEHDEITTLDYLTFNIENNYSNIHIIGNPPFGRQSSLAIKFIKKSCIFCNSLSFILPKSFKKDSLKKHFPLNYHLIFEFDLPEKSFLVDNKDHDVPCVFQIWVRKSYNREIKQKLYPQHFKFVKKEEDPDISFRRVGVNAGNIDREIKNKSIQSHYFIKFMNNNTVDENITSLLQIQFTFNNTVGPKSISKQELIEKFNVIL